MDMAEGKPILIVDDDEAILDLLQMALEDEGHRVLLARNGVEALDVLAHTNPGLILLDLRMPRLNGWEFAEAYRRRPAPHAPIVVMTAGRDAAQAAETLAACSHLDKPFDLPDLFTTVQGCLPR
jgi:CheY-like chemotaxis protein